MSIPWASKPSVPGTERPENFIVPIKGKLHDVTGEPRATAYLMQRISLQLQRENAASALGTYLQKDSLFINRNEKYINIGNISNAFFTLIPTVDVKTCTRAENLLLTVHLMLLSG